MSSSSPSRRESSGLRLEVRLAPRARREGIERVERAADGSLALRVAVNAPPVDGRANEALIALLARAFGVAKRDVTLLAGAAARNKRLVVAGDPGALAARLDATAAGPRA